MMVTRRSFRPLALGACAALTALLGACVEPVQAPAPAPAAPPPLPRAVALPPPPPPGAIDWHDMPATPGMWQWRRDGGASVARFGEPAVFTLSCNPLTGTISLTRNQGLGAVATRMSIVTTTGSRTLTITPGADGETTTLTPRDPLLDAMAYSRGRFAVEVPGLTTLYLPSWPEVSRVIEDCRAH